MAPVGHRVDGLKVAKARQALGKNGNRVSQVEFARRIGVHPVTMNRIENGKANVSLELLEKIAAETKKRREHFLAEDDEEESQPMGDHHEMLAALAVALEPFHPRTRETVRP